MLLIECNAWSFFACFWQVYDVSIDENYKRGIRLRLGSRVFRLWKPET